MVIACRSRRTTNERVFVHVWNQFRDADGHRRQFRTNR
jgi:hypothetical protein